MLGRSAGAYALYSVGRGGTTLVKKLMGRLKVTVNMDDSPLARLFRRVNLLNPFSAAVGSYCGSAFR